MGRSFWGTQGLVHAKQSALPLTGIPSLLSEFCIANFSLPPTPSLASPVTSQLRGLRADLALPVSPGGLQPLSFLPALLA
jgi:hypothetical protein